MAVGRATWRRCLAGVLLSLVTAGGFVGAHLAWTAAVDRSYREQVDNAWPGWEDLGELSEQQQNELEKEQRETRVRYREKERAPRSGTSEFRLALSSGWDARARHRLTLNGDDPFAADLRSGGSMADWMPFTARLKSEGDCYFGKVAPDAGVERTQVEQKSPKAKVSVTSEVSGEHLAPKCLKDIDLDGSMTLVLKPKDARLGAAGIYDRWTVSVRAEAGKIQAVQFESATQGQVLRQSLAQVDILLPAKGTVAVTVGDFDAAGDGRSDFVILSDTLQSTSSTVRDVSFLLAAFAALLFCLVLPFTRAWAPPSTLRRWQSAVAVATVGTVLLLLNALGAFGLGLGTDEPAAWAGTAFAAWWWVVVPLLLVALAARLSTGRPPRALWMLLAATPGLALLAPVAALSLADSSQWPWLQPAAVTLLACAVAAVLRGGLLGVPGRRWAVTVAVAGWVGLLAVGPGAGFPEDILGRTPEGHWRTANTVATYALECFWPLAVLAALVALGVRSRVAAGTAVLLWWLLSVGEGEAIQIWTDYSGTGRWNGVGVGSSAAVNSTLVVVEAGVVCVAASLVWRFRHDAGSWPPHTRTALLTLGVTAAVTVPAASGFSQVGSGYARGDSLLLALAFAATGFAWLIPAAARSRAERLHATTQGAHLRRVHALLKEQALAAGRRMFLTASHTALAEGSLKPRDFNTRLRGLGVGAPLRAFGLRALALGSSGGRSAWRNGVAAAVFAGALSLPWIAYTLPPRISTIAVYDPPVVVSEWLTALRWPLYGFVYGYLYSWLRGSTPLGRAMCLLAVVLPAELASLLYQFDPAAEFGVSLLLTTGDCLAVFLALGLYWEARQVRAAGLRWGQIRNFRTLSSLAVPVTTVLVAVTTALATALVGVWATAPQESGPQPPQTSATSSP
ncbi:hypothetical protein OG440_10690 [Streptomyces sp. NBC_00637]|uniref:hypothetical protein n=1 Tax=Streptomyces sp. NBC_00637 TaxID=2903667 RepID=UPI003254B407